VDDLDTWPTGRLLSAAARLVEHEWDAHLARWDLNHAGLAVLHVLLAGSLTQRELAARVQVEDQTMSRTLERLERCGYVSRRRDPEDRRRVVVSLSEPGREAYFAAGDVAVAEGLFTQGVQDVQALRRTLVAIVRHRSEQRWGEPAPACPARVESDPSDGQDPRPPS
jgi:DNA-binding MarR family transcriptional regulator